MKFKTTKAAINEGYYFKICVGYCDLQALLQFENPVAYTSGCYGWNSDIYDLGHITGYDNACVVTGYRPFGNISSDYEHNRKYEKAAQEIVHDYKRDYEERKAEVQKLIKEWAMYYINQKRRENGYD